MDEKDELIFDPDKIVVDEHPVDDCDWGMFIILPIALCMMFAMLCGSIMSPVGTAGTEPCENCGANAADGYSYCDDCLQEIGKFDDTENISGVCRHCGAAVTAGYSYCDDCVQDIGKFDYTRKEQADGR